MAWVGIEGVGMSRGTGRGSTGNDGRGIGDLVPWINVSAVAIFGPRLSALSLPEQVRRWVTPALYAVAGAVLLYAWLKLRRRRRSRALTRLADGLAPLLGRGFDVTRVRGRRWRRGLPTVVDIDYPDEVDDRDPEWRQRLVSLVQHRMSAAAVTARWDERNGSLRVSARRPDPVPEVSELDAERQRAHARVVAILAPIFGTDITVDIPAWRAREEASRESSPAHLRVQYATMTRDTSVVWQKRVEAILGLKLGGRWRGHFDPTRDRAEFRPRPELAERVAHPGPAALGPELRPARPRIPYGVDEDARETAWTLGVGALPHTLAIGPTGGGKTTFLRSVVTGATGLGVLVFGCDPKRIELTPFRGWPGVRAVASSPEDMAALITAIHAEMMRRYAVLEGGGSVEDMARLLLVIDEFLILRASLNRLWAVAKPKGARGTVHPALGLVTEMLVLARSAGIHLVIGVQRPDASIFGDEGARDNLRHRISLTRLSREGSTMLWGSPYVGVDLPLLPGRAMGSPGGDTPVELQTYWLSDPRRATGQDAQVMAELRARAANATEGLSDTVDLGELSAQALDYLVQDEARVITAPADIPVSARGPVDTITDSRREEGAGIDVQNVPADSLMPGDRVLTATGEVGTVRAVEVANYDDDLVEVDIDSPSGGEVLAVGRDELLARVVDLDHPDDDAPGLPADSDEDDEEEFPLFH